jgi:hypothetical protein
MKDLITTKLAVLKAVLLAKFMEVAVQALIIKIFKIIYQTKIHAILVKKAEETETEIDDKFVVTLNKFVESL